MTCHLQKVLLAVVGVASIGLSRLPTLAGQLLTEGESLRLGLARPKWPGLLVGASVKPMRLKPACGPIPRWTTPATRHVAAWPHRRTCPHCSRIQLRVACGVQQAFFHSTLNGVVTFVAPSGAIGVKP